MMDVWPTLVDLSKFRHRVPESPGQNKTSSHFFLEGKLGAGKYTNGHITIVDRGKTPCIRVGKVRRYQLVSHLRRAGRDEMRLLLWYPIKTAIF